MNPDIALILGLVIGGFAIPSMLSALSDRRTPRASAVTVLMAGGLVIYALNTRPGGYRIDEIPDVFYRVLGQILG